MAGQSQHTEKLLARDNGQTLYEHTREVAEYSKKLYGGGELCKELEIAALFHDLGKAQKVYQDLYGGKNVTKQREHAVASAWIYRFLPTTRESVNCIVARLIESHHKGFHQTSKAEYVYSAVRDAVNAIQGILESNDKILEYLEQRGGVKKGHLENEKSTLEAFSTLMEKQPKKAEIIIRKLNKNKGGADVSLLVEVRRALGALVVADSLSAAGYRPEDIHTPREGLPPDKIVTFVSRKKKDRSIDRIRTEIGKMVEEGAKKVDLTQKIFTVALPTGAGKTLHSLRFATILGERIHRELNREPPKIIYVMPFTTIIDQAYDVFKEIYGELVERKHYLADEKGSKEIPEKIAEIADLTYPAEITVTTYVQLYSALVGNGRKDAIRALSLRNRIIIMDEVQAVPHGHWGLMRELIKAVSKDNWIIMMSATVPKYVVPEKAYTVIKTGDVHERDVFNRHVFVQRGFGTYDDVVADAVKRYLEGESVAVVVNTVRTAEEMYQTAKKILLDKGIRLTASESGAEHEGGSVVYLSTYVPPFARKGRINRFKNHVLAITTQVIEAGVDVSVDVLYRELAPVDSIVQAAGRCNRNGEQEIGDVIIFKTGDTEKGFLNVYGKVLWTATNAALEKEMKYLDSDMDKVLTKYYKYIKMSEEDHNLLMLARKAVENCSFYVDAKIIDNIPRCPVVVMYPEAQSILKELENAYKREEKDRKIISRLFRELGAYIVNVYPKQAKRFKGIEVGSNILYCVNPDDESKYMKDVGVLYCPADDPDAFEDRSV